MSPRVLFEQDLETLKNKVSEMGEHAEISYDHMLYGIRENKEDILRLCWIRITRWWICREALKLCA